MTLFQSNFFYISENISTNPKKLFNILIQNGGKVLEDFNENAFIISEIDPNKFNQYPSNLITPNFIYESISLSKKIMKLNHPFHSYCLNGENIYFNNLSTNKHKKILFQILCMNGQYSTEITPQVTHIIIDISEENRQIINDPRVIDIEWIEQCWNNHRNIKSIIFPQFSKCCISTTGFSEEETKNIENLINKFSGEIHSAFIKKTTHLITKIFKGSKYESAIRQKKTIVTIDWLRKMILLTERNQFFRNCIFYFDPNSIKSSIISILKENVLKFGGIYLDNFNNQVTHLIIQRTDGEYYYQPEWSENSKIIDIEWINECLRKKKLVNISNFSIFPTNLTEESSFRSSLTTNQNVLSNEISSDSKISQNSRTNSIAIDDIYKRKSKSFNKKKRDSNIDIDIEFGNQNQNQNQDQQIKRQKQRKQQKNTEKEIIPKSIPINNLKNPEISISLNRNIENISIENEKEISKLNLSANYQQNTLEYIEKQNEISGLNYEPYEANNLFQGISFVFVQVTKKDEEDCSKLIKEHGGKIEDKITNETKYILVSHGANILITIPFEFMKQFRISLSGFKKQMKIKNKYIIKQLGAKFTGTLSRKIHI
ncbi:DNA replication regulator dpb11-related [Anaeramoeba ignava]|uniref:DNA replication regulator dpb11-related n=1 Tax=Anaeramoeba ignava TaxID=1746090 RepID=A0A9Q0RHF1_ANAIG|nr:DNA replication regulator dpb11-related [Anaeramoeba ignava]